MERYRRIAKNFLKDDKFKARENGRLIFKCS
jgi:hypothetical protein